MDFENYSLDVRTNMDDYKPQAEEYFMTFYGFSEEIRHIRKNVKRTFRFGYFKSFNFFDEIHD